MMKKKNNNAAATSSSSSLTQNQKGLKSSQFFYTILILIITYSFCNYNNIHDKLAWYRIYHRTPYNQIIHFFGVPGLLWTAFLYGIHIPIPFISLSSSSSPSIKLPFIPNHQLSYALIGLLIYTISYLVLDPIGGMLYFPFLYLLYGSVVILYNNDQQKAAKIQQVSSKKKNDDSNNNNDVINTIPWYGTGLLLKIAFWIHILCWYVQIHPGHAIFEGAKPALLDSLGDALTAAPLFAYHELLWYLGFRQQLLQITIDLVDKYTEQLCNAGSTMRICSSM